jgi:hypothetical protein
MLGRLKLQELAAFVMAASVLAACNKPEAPRFAPSSEPGIELPKFYRSDWSAKTGKVMFAFRMGGARQGLSGFHIDADGTVWNFTYAARRSGLCNVASIEDGSEAFSACLYENSRLLARLTPDLLEEVRGQAARIADGERLKGGEQFRYDVGFSLSLSGHGTRAGKPILLARCHPREQLASPEARFFIELFHRIGRVLPRFVLPKRACRSDVLGLDIIPGVRAWSVPPGS